MNDLNALSILHLKNKMNTVSGYGSMKKEKKPLSKNNSEWEELDC